MKTTHRNTLIATALAVALTTGATTALAWGGNERSQDPAERFSYIFSELNLSNEQAEDVFRCRPTFGRRVCCATRPGSYCSVGSARNRTQRQSG